MRSLHSLSWLRVAGTVTLLALALLPCSAADVQTTVAQTTGDHVTLHYVIPAPTLTTVDIDGQAYVEVALDRETLLSAAGAPALPHVCRSIILPDAGTPVLNVLSATYEELTEIDVVPSKGILMRTVNPDDVPYEFGAAYATDAFYPGPVAELGTPYILRDYRGVVVALNPFQYNPVKRTLRVYRDIVVEVVTRGNGGINVLDRTQRSGLIDRGFQTIYAHQFVNHAQTHLRYDPLDEQGDLLIICYDAWLTNVQPLVTHKTARGLNTTLVGVGTIGNNATAIKTYIQNVYNSSDLAYVLLVGDSAQVATPSASGGASDPTYSKLAGGDDYPDILVGRFSAETAAQVDTQVLRTITYENLPAPLQDWFWKGTGVASSLGAGQGDEGQADYVHMDEIRQWLLACGYTLVDQIYDTNGGTAAMVSNALNAGRGVVNYTGHGSVDAWSSTGFSSSHVAALVNDNMLPFIVSVACVNGQFNGTTCFAEAWLRASHNGVPTGAIATYMSSVNQPWAPPMEAQDEFNLLICAETYVSYGALCYAGSCSMMDDYGSEGVSVFDTWHIFGDPSLRIALTCLDQGSVKLDAAQYGCEDTALISVTDCGLNLDDLVIDTATVTIASDTEPAGETVVVTELGPALGQFSGSIALSATNAAGVLQVGAGDTITLTYIDADNGQGTQVTVSATAVIDCTPPTISNVQATDIQARSAVITFDCNELATGTVHYGLSCNALNSTAGGGLALSPSISLSGLTDNTTYYYKVEAADEAGNVAQDPTCYSFTTPEVPDFFTELFSGENDLDYQSLSFTPNNSTDFYLACNETITALPTDPTGGTTITLTDDSSVQINLTGGASVSLYGVSYTSFYVGSNGYITFTAGDSAYTETLEAHFDLPRITGLFDDLDPAQSGTLSWKQLADRAVVTWLNTPEHNGSNQNTFQIEMYFNGQITINYLAVAATDGLAGLSRGTGVDPDFLMSDLTSLGVCQTFPPTASDGSQSLPVNTPATVTIVAEDDGLPNPPSALTFSITALPIHGALADPNGGAITAVPCVLLNGGNVVTYTPATWYVGADSFQFLANDGGTAPDGGDSNIATVSLTVYGVPEVIYSFPLNTNPGWTTTGAWAFGHPTGAGTHNKDPNNGYTGTTVYGYNLTGDYTSNMPVRYLTTTALNCTNAAGVELRFWRWLGVEQYDHAAIEVSTDGSTWAPVWANTATISETAWSYQTYTVPAADHQASVYFRWSIGPTDTSVTYPGWNIDDVEIWAVIPHGGSALKGDMNCDGVVGFGDINPFVLALSNPTIWTEIYLPLGCDILNGDINEDGALDFADINPFVALLTTTP